MRQPSGADWLAQRQAALAIAAQTQHGETVFWQCRFVRELDAAIARLVVALRHPAQPEAR